jgi:hypothetical protein
MDFFPTIWNVLHDGIIIAVTGAVPGTVRLNVSIDYLCKRFPEGGENIQVTLTSCTRFAYRDENESEFTTDFSTIAAFEPWIVNAKLVEGLCVIDCNCGVFAVRADDGSLALESGRVITLQELIDVAEAYWKELSDRAKKGRQT